MALISFVTSSRQRQPISNVIVSNRIGILKMAIREMLPYRDAFLDIIFHVVLDPVLLRTGRGTIGEF